MFKNRIALSVILVASFANVYSGIFDECPLSDAGKVVGAFLAISAVRTAINTRQVPATVSLIGIEAGDKVVRKLGVGSYVVTETNPAQGSVVGKIDTATMNLEGFSVGNAVRDGVLTATLIAALKYGVPAFTNLIATARK